MNSRLIAFVGIGALTVASCYADILDRWTKRFGAPIRRVRYLNGLFVGVGSAGTIVTSSNGITWTSQSSGTTRDLYGVGFGALADPYFVAVGDQTVLVSRDATNWLVAVSGSSIDFRDVAFTGTRFVAVGADNGSGLSPIWHASSSFAPTNWVPVSNPGYPTASNNAAFYSIAFGGGRLVAGGDIRTGIWTSSSGLTWAFRGAPISEPTLGVAYGNDRFIAVGDEGPPLVSTNGGSSWAYFLVDTNQSILSPVNYSVGTDVTFADGRFISIGRYTLSSTNGIDWVQHSNAAVIGLSLTAGAGFLVSGYPFGSVMGLYQSDSLAGRLQIEHSTPIAAATLSLSIDAGRSFGVEVSSNLIQWTEIWRGTNTGTLATQFIDAAATTRRFYRAVTP